MSRPAEELLEFPRLRGIVGGFATCGLGRRAVLALSFRTNTVDLEPEFSLIREAQQYLRTGKEMGFGAVADPETWLSKLAIPGSVLASAELLDAATLLDAAGDLKATIRGEAARYPWLADCAASLADFRPLTAAIRRVIAPSGEIHDHASPALARIRTSMVQAREQAQRDLRHVLQARNGGEGEDYITLRNDRFVIPVRSLDRRAVPGVVHGASASGQTLFVEPLAVIELNNRLVQLVEEEAEEIARLLAELTEKLRTEGHAIAHATETVARVDSVFARARFAKEFNCVTPEFARRPVLYLRAARNPVLQQALAAHQREIVPVTIDLGIEADDDARIDRAGSAAEWASDWPAPGGTVMVISGPNTGGKTVALKTAGLAVMAAQSGIPVAAERAVMAVFDGVLADIGDEQSITADLSTFSAHVLNLKNILAVATERSLILLDEIGTGTAPEEGSALAVAVLEEFRSRGALTIATTHHDRVKTWASTASGIVNAAAEFDEERLQPTYRLLTGVPGVSYGLEIAARLGLPDELVERARASLSPEVRETRDLIAWLHRTREAAEQRERELAEEQTQLRAEREFLRTEWVDRQRARIAGLEKEFASALAKLESEVTRLTADISDRKERARVDKLASRRMGGLREAAREDTNAAVVQQLAASQEDLGIYGETALVPPVAELLEEGARVRVRGFAKPMLLRRKDARMAEVEAGMLRMKVPLSDILAVESESVDSAARASARARAKPPVSGNNATRTVVSTRDSESRGEINVIGCTVEDASERVDKFLDDAVLAQKLSVRIIHGHGTGALRRGLAEFLSTHPHVDKFHAEEADRGGSAVTVVELYR
jgi:DNA mismatch repair protein MutS2